jgi:hypothetical protein
MSNLKRKQIYLDEESDRVLKLRAIETKISELEHIRRAVANYITKQKTSIAEKDPIREIIILCDSPHGPTNASIHDDRYLYGKKGK